MASNSQCDLCSRVEKCSAAIQWCVDCEDALCKECVTAHKGNKASMRHHLIELGSASTFPPDIVRLTKHCAKHPKFNIDFFCTFHDSLCCKTCISEEHRSCNKVMPIETASENVKDSSLYRNVSVEINQVHETLQELLHSRRENKDRVSQEEKNIIESISTLKARLIKKLDELETTTVSQLNKCKHESDSKIAKDETEINKSSEKIEEYLKQLNFVVENGSDQHVFQLLHELQPKIAKEQTNLETLLSNLSNIRLVHKESTDILDIKSIGSIELEISNVPVKYHLTKYLEAQEMTGGINTSPKSFTFGYAVDGQFGQVTGIIVDKDNNLLIVDGYRLLMYSQEGKYIKECKLEGTPWNIAQHPTSGKLIASTRAGSVQIVTNFIAQTPITVPGLDFSCAVIWVNDNIFVGGRNGEIHILNSDGKPVRKFTTDTRGIIAGLHYKDNKVYFTDETNKVYCVAENGTHVFTMTFTSLNEAQGITTDRQGYVYVAGVGSNNILRLSSDGKDSTVVLKDKDGITGPLCFSRDYKRLFISCGSDRKIFVFMCEY